MAENQKIDGGIIIDGVSYPFDPGIVKDSTIGTTPSTTNVPTSAAVASYVAANQPTIPTVPTVDTAIGTTPSTTNVPTSKAVADYVDAHGGSLGDLPITEEDTDSDDEFISLQDNSKKELARFDKNGLMCKSFRLNLADVKWAEIGDSFVYPDNINSGTSGWGAIVRNHFGISPQNHHVYGANGKSWINILAYDIWSQNTSSAGDTWNNIIKGDEDFITINLGTNDWGASVLYPIGTKNDYLNDTMVQGNYATYTSYGAARKIVDLLLSNRGKTSPIVIICSPMHRGQFGTGSSYRPSDMIGGEEINNYTWLKSSMESTAAHPALVPPENGSTLRKYVEMNKWICEHEGFVFVDLYDNGFVIPRFTNQGNQIADPPSTSPEVLTDILIDNLHPYTQKGKELYAREIINCITKKFTK